MTDWMDKAAYVRQFPVGQEPSAREIEEAVSKPPKRARPQVLIEQTTGLMVDYRVVSGDVDVIFIDWSEVTPDHDGMSEDQFENFKGAAAEARKLPPDLERSVLKELTEWLEMYVDPNTGYTERDEFRKHMVRTLRRLRHRIVSLEDQDLP